MEKIGFGGGCHWCTEAVFQVIKGVHSVEQGYIKSTAPNSEFSEAVIVHFDPDEVQIFTLIKIHLQTHSSTSSHSMRKKYRSAIYTFSGMHELEVLKWITNFKKDHSNIITKVLPFKDFKPSPEEFRNYFIKDHKRPFCRTYIAPKLKILEEKYPDIYNLSSKNSPGGPA